MEVKNLNQLKNALHPGARFEIVSHCRAAEVGQIREVNLANTQGIYSVLADVPDADMNKCNGGKGMYLSWGKATEWSFSDGLCCTYRRNAEHTDENLLVSFRMVA